MGDYELYHAATRKHKYIKKIGNRYFYTQQELNAYYQDTKQNDVIVKDDIVKDVVVRDNKMPNGASAVNRIAKNVAENDKRQKAKAVTERTVRAANKVERAIPSSIKTNGKLKDVKEAVAEATGRRDVYYEAKKVTENGRTYYDDDNAELRTGKKDKKGRVDKEDGSVYTKSGTMQYDNEYTIERNKKTRARGKKKLKKMATSPVRNLKKQASRGKKAIDKYYTKATTPNITVTYDEAKLK